MSKYNRKLLSTWWRFLQKSTYENTEPKEVCSWNFILLVNETKNKKQRILIYLTKTVLKRRSNAIFSMKKVNLVNRNWTGKLQITDATPKSSVRKGLLTNVAKFAGKHPRQVLLGDLFYRAPTGECFSSNTTFRLYFLKEIVLAHVQSHFGRSNRDVFWKNVFRENEGKMHDGVCVIEFFSLTCSLLSLASPNFITG